MRRVVPSVLVASLALVAAVSRGEEKTEKLSNPAILEQLGKAVDAITDEKGPAELTDRLASTERGKVEDAFKKASNSDYADLAKEFNKAWRDKYDKAFNAGGHLGIMSENPVTRFEYEGHEYASINVGGGDDKAGDNGSKADDFELRMSKNASGNWRLLISDNVPGPLVARRITNALRDLVDSKDQWPKNESAAYAIAYHKLLEPLDYDAKGERKATKAKKDQEEDKKPVRRR